VKKEDVATYISSVVSILHLAQVLNLGQKAEDEEADSPTEKEDEPEKE